jgi:hypothetical protein
MSGKRMATAVSAVVLSMLVLIALAARVSWSSTLKYRDDQDDMNAISLRTKDDMLGTQEQGLEVHSSTNSDIDTQLRARKSKNKRGKGKSKKRSGKKGKRIYKIKYPKYAIIKPNEVTYSSSATDLKGQIVVEDWRQG